MRLPVVRWYRARWRSRGHRGQRSCSAQGRDTRRRGLFPDADSPTSPRVGAWGSGRPPYTRFYCPLSRHVLATRGLDRDNSVGLLSHRNEGQCAQHEAAPNPGSVRHARGPSTPRSSVDRAGGKRASRARPQRYLPSVNFIIFAQFSFLVFVAARESMEPWLLVLVAFVLVTSGIGVYREIADLHKIATGTTSA